MKVIITGVAGFIGSNLADTLLDDGHEVLGIDNFSTGQSRHIDVANTKPNFTLIEHDLLNAQELITLFKGSSAVYHFAANADIRYGLKNPKKDFEQNLIVTFNVLEAVRINNIRIFAFASSAAVLGEPQKFPTPENCMMPIQTSIYGASKMGGEGLISAYCEGYGIEGYIFRFVSLLGPRYPHGHIIDFYKQLKKDKCKLVVLGNGKQRKSYLHVKDCIEGIRHVIKMRTAKKAKHNVEIYNFGHSNYITVSHSVNLICKHLNVQPLIEYGKEDRGWIGDNPFVFLDISKIVATGWKPKIKIEESIHVTLDWLRDNEWILNNR